MAAPPLVVKAATQPAKPAAGGHYVNVGGNWHLIHAVGPGKWAPGAPVPKPVATPKAAAPRPAAPAANPYSNPLYQPSQQLSGKPLAQAVQQLTNVQYDPAISQLTQQIGQNTQQGAAAQQATAGYFNQLGQYAQQSADRVGATAQGLNTTLQNIGQGTQSALDQFGQQAVAAPALQQLANQGLGGGAPQQLAAALASQKLLASQNAASDQSYGAKVGANAATLAGENLGTYALRGQERLGQIAAATRLAQQPVETKLATERALKSQAYGTNLMSARQAERNYAVAQQGLNLKQTAITQTANTAAANRIAAGQRNQATITGENQRNQANIDARAIQGNLDRKSREGIAQANRATQQAIAAGKTSAAAGKPATPAQQRTMWNSITGIQGRVTQLTSWLQQWGATPAAARAQAWKALKNGKLFAQYDQKQSDGTTKKAFHWIQIPPVGDIGLLNVAYNSLGDSGLSPGDVSYLHNMGFTIGNKMKIAPARTPGNALNALGPGLKSFW
jgi:hypothetical protein